MREPNFSESQLQQAVNTSIVRYFLEKYGVWTFASVPSLFDEFDLGWDSAFYLPGVPYPAHPEHEGCNFFIQYKLSGELTSAGAKEWKYWKKDYFRFKIPHSTKDISGKFVDDYHQWDRLKDLANIGYPTFYATNSTLNKDVLRKSYDEGSLLNEIPLLDVRSVSSAHKHVTFTPESDYFAMHSQKQDAPKETFLGAFERLSNERTYSLGDGVALLLSQLKELNGNDIRWRHDLERVEQVNRISEFRNRTAWIIHRQLSLIIYKNFGVQLLWLPKM